jgi:hypothetical protein
MDRVRGLILVIQLCCFFVASNANLVFPVERKFKGPHHSLDAIKAHDDRRRGRFLSAVDVPLGGDGLPSSTGFAFFFPLPFSLFMLFYHLIMHRPTTIISKSSFFRCIWYICNTIIQIQFESTLF